ncbi:MAG TPA: phosphoenolpyruvate carboxykinase (GTP) [Candidatus Altiarchaeales archaeon]|mgnify:CR=1 FL=1|nr:phosphoenolpyruvate carboxykinase (GTP) [Candidatus Altiarchaeales archaeon]
MNRDFMLEKIGAEGLEKLEALKNKKLLEFIEQELAHLNPKEVFVATDSPQDIQKIREFAVEKGEEGRLKINGHTYHFDSYFDQARDKEHTKILSSKPIEKINTISREAGLAEVKEIMKNIMEDKTMYIMFFTLGPVNSKFSIPCVQLTDSAYVVHNETILFRPGYEQFKKSAGDDFFKFVHSAGELTERNTSKNIDKRRVYIDVEGNITYSANTQYGGNTIGLKKLAMRFSIRRGSREGWLCEHMFVMGVHNKDRTTYFTGAFPSACGKTSTSMVRGETIVGDDIAYLRVIDGEVRAVNVEKGIFGIIKDVNSKNDPIIHKALTTQREIIFSNVLVNDGVPYWLGGDRNIPDDGINYAGEYKRGMKGPDGKEVNPSHKNARYTLAISELDNKDELADEPAGVTVGGFIYGGRDSDTSVPVEEAFTFEEGIIAKGASIESETTAATLGAEGVRKFNAMSNMDFLSIPLGRYIQDNLDLGAKAEKPPKIYSVNYFLKDADGNYVSGMEDKRVWLKWMDMRVHGEAEGIKTPTGIIPKYADLKKLFKDNLSFDYTKEMYDSQFTIRVSKLLEKNRRIQEVYNGVSDTPKRVFEILDEQKKRLEEALEKHGDNITPDKLE